jgi:hypothetical protein
VEQATTLGRLADPSARAVGTVTFANRQGGSIAIPTGTILATPSGVRFATNADAALDGQPGTVARVPVSAIDPGDRGNVARLEISRVVGALAGRLGVLNEEPTVGGGTGDTAVVSPADLARVRASASERAHADAESELRAELGPDEVVLGGSLEYSIVDEVVDHSVGDQIASFNYKLRARVSQARVARSDVRQLVQEAWQPGAPTGFFIPADQLEVGVPTATRREGSKLVVKVPVRVPAVARIDDEAVRSLVRGRPADEARRALARSFTLPAEPRVTIQPPWPGVALRVDIALDLNPPAPARG